jgi:hypothetical protein
MKNHPNDNRFKLKPLVLGITLISVFGVAQAKTLTEASTLLETVGDPNESLFMKKMGLKVGGWANAGITYNAASPDNNFNGPVTFGDRSGEFQLNQLYLFAQRAVAAEGDAWDFGGRFDAMFGTDSIFTQAYGVPALDVNNGNLMNRSHWDLNMLGSDDNRFYDIALPQAYAEIYAPVGNGLTIKAGHFYTPIGYEVVTAPDNFFYTHAYTMQYGEPFTHTGLQGNYNVDKNWMVMGGAVTGSATGGWDGGWDKQLGNWAGMAGLTYTSDDKGTRAWVNGTYGGTSEHSSQSWSMYSAVLTHNITDKTHLMLQHDHGYANGVLIGTVKDAEWYGINMHLTYDLKDNLTAGVRTEWFRDQDGFRVWSPGRISAASSNGFNSYASGAMNTNYSGSNFGSGSSYYAITAGMNWKPMKWLNIRPNVRYDWADGTIAATGGQYRPFGNNKQDQFLFSSDFTINF